MPEKYKAPHTVSDWYSYTVGLNGRVSTNYANFTYGGQRIVYDDGKRLPSGRWPWKECVHTVSGLVNPFFATATCAQARQSDGAIRVENRRLYKSMTAPRAPTGSFDRSVVSSLFNQLDLNVSDSVLLYSGVLQAVPLVGAALKLSSILNRAGRRLSKSFRKKPFTTVLKSLISLDFIDRFVISPTIDDARKFATATNYVLNVINTARERSSHIFGLESRVITVLSSKETIGSDSGGNYAWTYVQRDRRELESKAFALLEAKYDIDAVSPLKLWASRTGLTRPLDSAWDLIPFSFVVDYFTRAGDFISALSDEMSSQQGLAGRIVKVHDLWGTFSARGTTTVALKSIRFPQWTVPGYTPVITSLEKSTAKATNETFRRFRIADPWSYLLAYERQIDKYISVGLPSSTQKRTIAELVIQAKL